MGKNFLLTVIWVILIGSPAFIQAQTSAQTGTASRNALISGSSLDSQFIYLIRISKTQEDFKLVRRTNMELLRKNTTDSLQRLRKEIADAKNEVPGLTAEIGKLRDSLNNSQHRLSQAEQANRSIVIAGMPFSIMTYQLTVWGIIILLSALLLYVFFRSARNNSAASEAKDSLAELKTEYDAHRKKSLEKEQKLMRQLQDEINKRNT